MLIKEKEKEKDKDAHPADADCAMGRALLLCCLAGSSTQTTNRRKAKKHHSLIAQHSHGSQHSLGAQHTPPCFLIQTAACTCGNHSQLYLVMLCSKGLCLVRPLNAVQSCSANQDICTAVASCIWQNRCNCSSHAPAYFLVSYLAMYSVPYCCADVHRKPTLSCLHALFTLHCLLLTVDLNLCCLH